VHLLPLLQWLSQYSIPSIIAIASTYVMLYLTQLKALKQKLETNIPIPELSQGGKLAIVGIAATAIILLMASAMDIQLGLPTAVTGVLTSAIVILKVKKSPWIVIKDVSWAVLPLVAGLFVMVEALNKTGLTQALGTILHQSLQQSVNGTAWGSGMVIAFTCNLMNNLPVGLIAGNALQSGQFPGIVKSAVLVGVDLGPNLSITGSLATILWLVALRREGQNISAWSFLKIGILIMTVTLALTLGSLWI
jgi:arsenical pump membrane protein